MTCCDGERAVSTSSPMAFCLMFSMSCLTTRKLTSASSSAMRISRRALSMFSALSLPSPRRFLNTRCSFSDRLSNIESCIRPHRGRGETLRRCSHYTRSGRGRSDAEAAGSHLAGAIHTQLVQDTGSRPQVRGQAFSQARDVEEDVPAAVIGAQESEAFGFEVSDHGTGLLAGGGFPATIARFGGAVRLAGLIADALLNQGQIVFGQFGGGLCFGGHLEVRIALPGLLK